MWVAHLFSDKGPDELSPQPKSSKRLGPAAHANVLADCMSVARSSH